MNGPVPAPWAQASVRAFLDASREHTVVPMWFWNDDLEESEISRQLRDFAAHGVHGFMIHPRVGLPRELSWLSPRLLDLMRFAAAEAQTLGMLVYLYDEAMYPSGASAGQVAATDPRFAGRCLDYLAVPEGAPPVAPQEADQGRFLAIVPRAGGGRIAVFARPSGARIRGVHYTDASESTAEHLLAGRDPPHDHPLYADLLNPAAVDCFLRLVYARFAAELGNLFGHTIRGVFTDEPNPGHGPGTMPGNVDILPQVNRLLGYDFTPHLPALWFDDEPDALHHRTGYFRAIRRRLTETYFVPLSRWCDAHGLELCGHPQWPDDQESLRHFHVPGQDIVGRALLPGNSSGVEGRNSVLARSAASAMLHGRRRRCGMEIVGSYGHRLTWDEMKWVTDWCLLRGINQLYPHAFYYSYRGRRRDERPPDVGPRSPWWDRYRAYADYCRRLCWLNTGCEVVCDVAVLAGPCWVPWRAGRVLQEAQIDFTYLEVADLGTASWSEAGVQIADRTYRTVVLDWEVPDQPGEFDDGEWHAPRLPPPVSPTQRSVLQRVAAAGRLVQWLPEGGGSSVADAPQCRTAAELLEAVAAGAEPDVSASPAHADLRCRHVLKAGAHWYLFCNEGEAPLSGELQIRATGPRGWLDPFAATFAPLPESGQVAYRLAGGQTGVLLVGAR